MLKAVSLFPIRLAHSSPRGMSALGTKRTIQAHQRLSAIGGTADIGDWGTRAHWNFAIDTSRDGAALRPTVASRNYPTLAFKSHNPALIGPAFDGTDRGVSKWCCARAPQSAALQFFLSIHPLQWPSWEPSMLIHILAE